MNHYFKLLASIAFTFATLSASANQSCRAILQESRFAAEVSPANEMVNALKLSTHIMTEIRKQSKMIKLKLQKEPRIFDVVCLGAGPQCAAASIVLGQTSLKSLVVEKSDTVSANFSSKDFMINSSETSEFSMHEVPGSILNLDQIMSSKYANSQQLATYIKALQFQSNVPVLLDTEVTKIDVKLMNGKEVVVLKTSQGTEILTNKIMIGTGLGEAMSKIPDANYKKVLSEQVLSSIKDPFKMKMLMNTETFMKALKLDPKNAKPVLMPQSIAMIGSGDGSRIALEALMESFVVMPRDFKIYWIGSSSHNAKDYIESQKGWDRYIEKILPHFEQGRTISVPGYGQTVEFLSSGKVKISIQNPDTEAIHHVEVDMVVDNTGYENVVLNNLLKGFPESSLKDVRGSLAERGLSNTALARQLTVNEKKFQIYFLGVAGGALASREELALSINQNSAAIYNNVPRTSAFVSQLTETPVLPNTKGTKTVRSPVMDADTAFTLLQDRRKLTK